MVSIPFTILDGFLDNPNSLRDWGLSLPFTSSPEGRWPGKRTDCLSLIHPPLHDFINRKVLSLFFEEIPKTYKTQQFFQLIENYQGNGWVHQDPNLFTYLIYLSKEDKINCGTSLYTLNPNKIHNINSPQDHSLHLRKQHHKSKLISPEVQKIKDHNLSSNYNKTLDVKDIYNRLLCFSSEQFHSANYFDNGKTPRLTLIGFVYNISKSNIPILRSKQTTM